MLLFAREHVLAGEARSAGLARHAGGEHQVLGAQTDRLAFALHDDLPLAGL
jgi:hypothetical protein